jgi:hypothetical protein
MGFTVVPFHADGPQGFLPAAVDVEKHKVYRPATPGVGGNLGLGDVVDVQLLCFFTVTDQSQYLCFSSVTVLRL